MNGTKVVPNFARFVNLGHWLGFHPYKYSKRDKKFLYNDSKFFKISLSLGITIQIFYQIFLIIRCIQTCQSMEIPSSTKFRSIYVTILYIIINFNHLISVKNYGKLHHINNCFIAVTSSLASATSKGKIPKWRARYAFDGIIVTIEKPIEFTKQVDENGKECLELDRENDKTLSHIVKATTCVGILATISRAARVFFNSNSPELFSSIASNPQSLPLSLKVVAALSHVYITGFHIYYHELYGLTTFYYSSSLLPTLQRMKVDVQNEKEFSWVSLYRFFNKLSVLQNCFTGVYWSWPLGCVMIICFFAAVNLFLAVVLENAQYLILGSLGTYIVLSYFARAGEVHRLSLRALESWKKTTRRQPLWFKKFHSSCRPIRIGIGKFFYADKRFVLTVISIIVQLATNLILTYRED